MTQRPDLQASVDVMIALAPSAATRNYRNYLLLLKPLIRVLRPTLKAIGLKRILSNDPPVRQATRLLCEWTYVGAAFCRSFLMSIAGFNRKSFQLSMIPIIDGHVPGGTSIDTMVQFAQNNAAGQTFQAFDYGAKENRRVYGTSSPRTYDLSQIIVPVHIFFSKNDLVVDYRDILWLATQLANVQSLNLASDSAFSHSDFLWGTNVNEVIYNKMIPLLPNP